MEYSSKVEQLWYSTLRQQTICVDVCWSQVSL